MSTGKLASSVLTYASWPLLTLTILVLWVAASLDILRHKGRGTFTGSGLLGMAAVVSVVAVIAVSGIFAVFAGQWSEALSRASSKGPQVSKPMGEAPRRAYIFSFGLENASYGSPLDPRGATESETNGPR